MTPEKLRALLQRCGVRSPIDRGTNYQALCPYHSETRPSWGISKTEPHFFGCFGCGAKGTIVTLLVDKMKCSRVRAEQLAETKITTNAGREIWVERENFAPTLEDTWEQYVPAAEAYRYLLKRKVSLATARAMRVKFDFEQARVLFPWKHEDKVVGVTGRIVVGEPDPQFKTLPYGETKKGRYLYTPAPKFSAKQPRIVIVEGEIDAALVFQDATPNVAALGFGTMTDQQADRVIEWGFKEAVIFTDDDTAGAKIADVIEEKLGDKMRIRRVDYSIVRAAHPCTEKLDPGALTPSERRLLIKASKSDLSI